jgi:hypothetical protein
MHDIIDGEPRDRLGESITSPYPEDDPDSEWNALLTAISAEFEEIESVRKSVLKAKFVDDATGEQLDKLATLFQIERRTGEDDPTFRTRIKARLRAQLSSGTNEDIRSAASALLNAETDIIDIIEDYSDGHPTINVVIPVDDFSEIQTPGDIWNEVLDSVAAVGVDLRTLVNVGSFEVNVIYFSPQTDDLGQLGDFFGLDAFDGQGAFGAGNSNNPSDTTTLSFDLDVSYSGSSSSAMGEGFASSSFGAGNFDGSSDETDVVGETTIGTTVTVSYSEASSTATETDGFGSGSFDGSGTFD